MSRDLRAYGTLVLALLCLALAAVIVLLALPDDRLDDGTVRTEQTP